jgi:hypothetical protein
MYTVAVVGTASSQLLSLTVSLSVSLSAYIYIKLSKTFFEQQRQFKAPTFLIKTPNEAS